jgi:hypothetical protein
MCVDKIQLVFGDWYASAGIVEILDEYPLPGAHKPSLA